MLFFKLHLLLLYKLRIKAIYSILYADKYQSISACDFTDNEKARDNIKHSECTTWIMYDKRVVNWVGSWRTI